MRVAALAVVAMLLLSVRPSAATSPAIRSSTSSTETADTMSHTVSLPATVESGDTLLVFFVADEVPGITFPGGWNLIETTGNGSALILVSYWKEADGTEDGTTISVSTTSSQESAHASYAISGAIDPDTQAPQATENTGADNSPDPPSISPTGGSKDYLFLAIAGIDTTSTNSISAYPSSYINTGNASSGGGTGVRIGFCTRALTASSEDPGVFTKSSTESWSTQTIAVHPASAATKIPLFQHHYKQMRVN